MCSSLKLSRLATDETFTNKIAEQSDAPNTHPWHAPCGLAVARWHGSRHGRVSVIADVRKNIIPALFGGADPSAIAPHSFGPLDSERVSRLHCKRRQPNPHGASFRQVLAGHSSMVDDALGFPSIHYGTILCVRSFRLVDAAIVHGGALQEQEQAFFGLS